MPSFQRLIELTLAIDGQDGEANLELCGTLMSLPQFAVSELVSEAVEARLVEQREDIVRLLPAGESIAAAMAERLADADRRSLESFQPYTTYVPTRWWP